MSYSPIFAVAAAVAALAGASAAAANAKPVAELVFKAAPPEVVAPRLASECTRRRMALIRNTPERVVCRQHSKAAAGWASPVISELWSFALDRLSRGRTKVKATPSFEAAGEQGYAVLSFRETAAETRMAMRGFMEDVRNSGLPTP